MAMNEKMKILIGHDGSESSDAMISDLKLAGLPAEADVFVASIAETWIPMPRSYGGVETSYVDETITGVAQARQLAAKVAERLKADFPDWTIGHDATLGSPSGVLLAKAESWNSDLVVVGSAVHSAIGRLIFGSVSQSILHHAPCSVRISRARQNASGKGVPVRLVIGIDGSEEATAAVDSIIARRWADGSQVRIVCAMARLLGSNMQQFDLQAPSKL
jgi:nucleotide-binding universal stress UspA family protein